MSRIKIYLKGELIAQFKKIGGVILKSDSGDLEFYSEEAQSFITFKKGDFDGFSIL